MTPRLGPGTTIIAAEPAGRPGGYDATEPNAWNQYQDFGHSHFKQPDLGRKAGERGDPDGAAWRERYFARNFPLAQAQGMFEVHPFRVDEVVAGDGRPEAASFLAWTSPKRADAFREEAGVCDEVRAVSWKDWNGPGDYIDSELFRRYQAQHDAVPAKIEMYRPGFW